MTGNKYLSEVVNMDSIKAGQLNIIDAPTGSGKTTFALETLANTVSNKNRMLYLIDTTNGKEQLLKNPITAHYTDGWREVAEGNCISFEADRVVVMTYAKFGVLADKYPSFGLSFEVIVCDELHSLMNFQYFSTDKNWHMIAKQKIEKIINENPVTRVVALTATPKKVKEEFHFTYELVDYDYESLRQYENEEVIYYTNIKRALDEVNGKGMVYVGHITKMKEIEGYLKERGLRTIAIWSIHNKEHEMTEEQITARRYILDNEKIPDNYDVLIINASSETCINLRGSIDFIIIHSQEEDTQTQVRGRFRGDVPMVYIYDSKTKVKVPAEYMGRKLFKEEKDLLCEELNLHHPNGLLMKWTTVKERLIEEGWFT